MEQLKHECGVAMIRLKKPVAYYTEKYHSTRWAIDKLYLMMEKQHNRGQEGAGIACVNLDAPIGEEYMLRERAEGKDAITEIFEKIAPFPLWEGWGEASLYLGHLRYSTTGKSGLQYVHPFMRRNNWRAKNLCLCGNFNMTNMDEVFHMLTQQGQSPRIKGDAYITLELMGHRLDREVERLYHEAVGSGLQGTDITRYIDNNVETGNVLQSTMRHFDGGYVMCGMTGSGEMFAVRDPWGIRPAFWYEDDEVVVVASERPVIQTTFNVSAQTIHELQPGQAIKIRRNGECLTQQILETKEKRACSFERIYFSRGSDCDIYRERKRLGELLTPAIIKAIDRDMEHTVFSYIPNTAEVAFHGMVDGMRRIGFDARTEKVVWKDIKLRTFISGANERNDLAAHVYDVTYGSIAPHEDNLVIIDDSIVRGTTLRESIFRILDRLQPKKIVMVSSAPQIRYPDYYGIDMSHLEELCAFRAAIALIEERGMHSLIDEVYHLCKTQPDAENHVRKIYEPFTVEELNHKIMQMLKPEDMQTPIQLVFQSIEALHEACPHHSGDWYFTGHYPTSGGTRLVNRAFVEYFENMRS